jgi:transcriptional regulator with XRE-family HTH domain
MHFIPQNLKFLRREKAWTQDQMAKHLGVKRSLIGAYEEGRADPRISFLLLVCQKFKLSMDDLVGSDLSAGGQKAVDLEGQSLRILPVPIDHESNTERASLVPIKAAAGYLNGYGDVDFIEQLPMFSLPYTEVRDHKTYRIFQIKGDSMLPVTPGSYVICSYVLDWNDVKNDQCYIVVSKTEGIVYKRLLNNLREGHFTLKSDNPEYAPIELQADEVLELWKAEGLTTFELPESSAITLQLERSLKELQQRLDALK